MDKWISVKTAPTDGSYFIGLVKELKGLEVYKTHYAYDRSGEEQPPFEGFFRYNGSYCSEVELIAWMPLPEPPTNQ